MTTAAEIIAHFKMQPMPEEGGFYVETYRAPEKIPRAALRSDYRGDRSFGTAIYYLLTARTFSAMHLVPGDEIFHFYLGDPVEMLQLKPDGTGETLIIGSDFRRGMQTQVVVPGGVWQGLRLVPGGKFALMGTTMSPGFEFEDYQTGKRAALQRKFPQFSELIACLTRCKI